MMMPVIWDAIELIMTSRAGMSNDSSAQIKNNFRVPVSYDGR